MLAGPDNRPEHPRRPPVVAVLGHVDHGKTTLLDAISNMSIAPFEPGKITQALSAFLARLPGNAAAAAAGSDPNSPYDTLLSSLWIRGANPAPTSSGSVITFLDTPGHAAFFRMRAEGTAVADFVLLVIAADEGIQAQTMESIELLRKLKTPMLVAINKIDIATRKQVESVYSHLRKNKFCVQKLTRAANPLLRSPPDFQFVGFCVRSQKSHRPYEAPSFPQEDV